MISSNIWHNWRRRRENRRNTANKFHSPVTIEMALESNDSKAIFIWNHCQDQFQDRWAIAETPFAHWLRSQEENRDFDLDDQE